MGGRDLVGRWELRLGPFSVASSTRISFAVPSQLLRATAVFTPTGELEDQMPEETEDREEIIERVAALDIGKAELVACVRVPSPTTPGRRA